ncbi:MAG: peptidoglycan binding domain-containing protein, partial [Oscillospiraceae bacterium]|nr:peptidoglycan binding domain-containing protein [Oscillospiraceae bacterium]
MNDWKRILEDEPEKKREKRDIPDFKTTEVNLVRPKRRPYFGLKPALVWITVGAVALCAVIAVLWVTMVAVEVRDYDRIYPGVSVYGIDVGGMTFAEAKEVIAEYSDNYFSGKQLRLICGDESVTLSVRDAMTSVNADYVAGVAYSYGRTGGIFARSRLINHEEPRPVEISSGFTINSDYVAAKTEELAALVEKDFVNYKVTNTGTSLEITRGQDGLTINRTELIERVDRALETSVFDDIEVEGVVQRAMPPDVDYLRGTIYVAPQNAYIERTGVKSY